MNETMAQRIVEKALERGLVAPERVQEALDRHAQLQAQGTSPGVLIVLQEVAGVSAATLAALDDRTLLGRTLGGFEIEDKLGEGGMGAVYQARQVSLGRRVALKVLDPTLACNRDHAERFRREARAAARLDHPHVVQPIDFGEDKGYLFFAMELMEGGSAAQRLAERGPFPEADALAIGIAMAQALEYAEAHGLVHRDIKPDNILFARTGTPKLADLGLVQERGDQAPITTPGVLIGTFHYMAPEQAQGARDLDVRSDIYALGVSLYQLLCGEPPFTGSSVSILVQHVTTPMPDVRLKAPKVSAHLAEIVAQMTAKGRHARFQSARELREALEDAAEAHASGAAPSRGSRASRASRVSGDTDPADSAAAGAGVGEQRRRSSSVDDDTLGVPTIAVSDAAGRLSAASGIRARDEARSSGASAAAAGARGSRTRLAVIAAVLALLSVGAGIIAWPRLRDALGLADGDPRASGGAVDPEAERAATRAVCELVRARVAGDESAQRVRLGNDAWSSAQVIAALAIVRPAPPPADLTRLCDNVRRALLRDAEGTPLGWACTVSDTIVATEVTGWVGVGFALATGLGGGPEAQDREAVRQSLALTQLPEGGFPSLPALGATTVRASGTALALLALTLLEAVAPEGTKSALDRIERGAQALAAHYDHGRHAWFPNERVLFGNRVPVPGLSEFAAYTLLEADRLLADNGRALPADAEAALYDWAQTLTSVDLPLIATGASYQDDYMFALPDGARTSLGAPRWVWAPWRILCAVRLARARGGALPNAAAWGAEAERLRARLPAYARELAEAPTFQVCESLIALALLGARPADDPDLGSLVALRRTPR